jgi:hypothetical protein
MAASTEDQTNSRTPAPPEKRVGYAIIGIGKLTAKELLPAFRVVRWNGSAPPMPRLANPTNPTNPTPDQQSQLPSQASAA